MRLCGHGHFYDWGVPRRITPRQKGKFQLAYNLTGDIKQACDEAGVSYAWGKAYAKGLRNSSGGAWREAQEEKDLKGPIPYEHLGADAKRAYDDIGFFSERYFGLVAMPYQEKSVQIITELLASPYEEYLVVNQPPGTGKTTFWTNVLPAWMTVRNRTIRGAVGHFVQPKAERYSVRLRTALTRRVPVKAKPNDLRLGIAQDAVACLVDDYGRFRPQGNEDVWQAGRFTVAQFDDIPIAEKEPTWVALGSTSSFIGDRQDLVVWDDPWDSSKLRSADSRSNYFESWDEITEQRLEPGGLLIMQMQRLGPDDLSAHCLSKKAVVLNKDGEEEGDGRKYHHIKFKAHYEENCHGDHGFDAAPWPDGCLLYPKRLGWRKIASLMAEDNDRGTKKFDIVYQQADTAPGSTLVDPIWVHGGRDSEGYEYPGCWDKDRDLCELPSGLGGTILSVATVDPSPTQMWAVQWWCYHVESDQRFLMDLHRGKLESGELLDWINPLQTWTGIMEDWQLRSKDLGYPITTWVVERNCGQRWLLQYEHVRRWQAVRQVSIKTHDTTKNKADPDLGIWGTIPNKYKFGQVRLPGKQLTEARFTSLKLVDEVTKYPGVRTDDCLMAQWFLEYNLPELLPRMGPPPRLWKPTWAA